MAKLQTGTRIFGTANVDSTLVVGNIISSNSTSNTTGSLIVTGGLGVTGNVYSNAIYTNGLFYAANNLPITSANSFGRIAIAGQPTVAAGIGNDLLTIVAGLGISVAANATTNTITLSSTCRRTV